MPDSSRPRRASWVQRPALVLGLGLAVALGVTALGARAERQARLLRYQREVDAAARDLSEVFQGTGDLLDAARAHFELDLPQTDAAFAAYLDRLDLGRRAPGLRGVNLGFWLKPEEVPRAVAAAREDRSLLPGGHPDFALHPPMEPGRSAALHMVRFVHPLEGNAQALGFHSLSRADQQQAIRRVLATGLGSSSGPVQLAQASSPAPGLILRLPLYRPGRPHETPETRESALVGLLNGVWVPEEALATRIRELAPRLQVQLVDLGEEGTPGSASPLLGPSLGGQDALLQSRAWPFFGRLLELRFRPQPGHPVEALPLASLTLGTTLALLAMLGGRLLQLLLQRQEATDSELRRTEGKLSAMLSAFPDALFVLDADGTYLEIFSPEDLLAAPPARVLGRRVDEILPPEAGTAILRVIRFALATGRTQSMEYPLQVPSGTRTFDARVVPIPGPEAKVLWCARDITDRKAAEAALATREAEFRRFFDAAPVPMALNRIDGGDILLVNRAWLELVGLPGDTSSFGKAADYYTDPSERARFLQELEEKGSLERRPFRLRQPSGREIDTLVSSVRIHLAGEGVILNAFLDLTELRRSEAALRQAQKLESMGLLAGGIAHDFNNLLTALQGNLDLALEGPPEKVRPRLEAAQLALDRATVLTRQLLVYSGRMTVKREALDLAALARDMATLLEVSLPKGVRLEMDLPPDLPAVVGDRAQLQQAVMNLVTNAADAIGPRRGLIRLRLRAEDLPESSLKAWSHPPAAPGRHLLLSVTDDGEGMDAAVQARIFDPFFSTKEQGRGLGLSALLGILRAHQAGLHLRSAPGEGSTFTLAFPASDRTAKAPLPSQAVPDRFRGLALVVDDEASVRESAEAMLAALGLEVEVAAGGAEGLALARQLGDRLAFVLLDLTMPPPDGREVYATLRAQWPTLPILLSSGYADLSPGALGKDPHLGFLAKPYTLAQLRAALAERLPGI